MDRIIWSLLLLCSVAIAAFVAYLTFIRPDLHQRGVMIVVGTLVLGGGYPGWRLWLTFQPKQDAPSEEDEQEPPAAA